MLKERVLSPMILTSMQNLYRNGDLTRQQCIDRVKATPTQKMGTLDYKDITGEDYTGGEPIPIPSLQSQVNTLEIKTSLIAEEVDSLGGGN